MLKRNHQFVWLSLIRMILLAWVPVGHTPLVRSAENTVAYDVRNWQVEHGLPKNTIRHITQTSDGYLWIATDKEVIRFDGLVFRILSHQPSAGFEPNIIHCIHGDQKGGLWIGSGVQLFYYLPGQLVEIKTSTHKDVGVVKSICEDQAGQIYVAASTDLYQLKDDQLVSIAYNAPNGPGGGEALKVDSGNRLWVAWGNSLFYLDKGSWHKEAQFPVIINTIKLDETGAVWCGLNAGLMARFQPGTAADTEYVGPGSIFEITGNSQGTILYRISDLLYQYPDNDEVPLFLPNDEPIQHIQAIFQDKDQNLWLGTKGKGLALMSPQALKTYSTEQGLPVPDVKTIEEIDTTQIWVGTMGGGVFQITEGQFKPAPFTQYAYFGSIRKQRNGQLWIGAYGNHIWKREEGLFEIEPQSRSLAARCLFEDDQGRLWAGADGTGAERIGNGDTLRLDMNSGLASNNVRCFAQDATQAIWIGTDQGLHRYHQGHLDRFTVEDGLLDNRIQTLFLDSMGALWIGAEAAGLARYYQGTLTAKTETQGLLNDSVAQIIEDDLSQLWIGTNRQLFRTTLATIHDYFNGTVKRLAGKTFGKIDGMKSQQCSAGFQPNCLKASDGNLWFSTSDGVVCADPASIRSNTSNPIIHIDHFLADGEPVQRNSESLQSATLTSPKMGAYSAPRNTSAATLSTQQRFAVPAGTSRLEIQFTGILFSAPEDVQYRYRLRPYDSDWSMAGPQNTAAYTRVPPGNYSIEVQASNSVGVWNPESATLDFVVLPLLVQTWWFRSGVVLLILLTVFALSYGPILRRRQLARLRLQIARDLHDEVGSNLGSISLYSQLARAKATGSSAAKEEFKEIDRTIQQTSQSLRDVIWFTNPKFDTLSGMLHQMEDTADRMLAGKTVTFHAAPHTNDRRLSLNFRRQVFLVFREIMHNTLKHSQADHVDISIKHHQKKLIIKVSDSGKGFDLNHYCEGNGLNNMKQRIKELNGTFDIQSTPGKGTSIQVEVSVT